MHAIRAVTPDRILQTGLGSWRSRALLHGVKLDVFTGLSQGGKDLFQLAREHRLPPRAARDFFDALVTLGLLARRDGIYSNTAEAAAFLDRHQPTYVGNILQMANARLHRCWRELSEGLGTGSADENAPDSENAADKENDRRDPFGELSADPSRLKAYLDAMTALGRSSNRAIARRLPWWDYRTFLEVGAGQGDLAVQIALSNPHLRGKGFDHPSLSPFFRAHVAEHGVSERVSFHAGESTSKSLPKAEVVLMGHAHLLHDWDVETRRGMLKKAYEALPPGGTLVVYENAMDDTCRDGAFALFTGLHRFIRSEEEGANPGDACRRWMHEAGFGHSRVEPLESPEFIIVARK